MKTKLLGLALVLSAASIACSQGPRPNDLGAMPLEIGGAGVDWFTTWGTGLAEAKRSNRPIFFMSAAATCNGISGVF